MKKTFFRVVFSLLFAIPAFAVLPTAFAHAAPVNTVVKGSSSTLYWFASNGNRYVFPNANTYFTWFPNFSNVINVNDSDLATMPLAGSVNYRPGAKLVKIDTDPKVYAVSRYGILHWVTNPTLASQLYGSNWASQVQDIPVAFFDNYTVGSPIYSVSDYNVGNEYNSVSNPSDNIVSLGQTNCAYQNCSGGLTVSQTSIATGQGLTVNATFPQYGTSGYIQIVQGWDNAVAYSCPLANSCSVTLYPSNLGTMGTIQYSARYLNAIGGAIVTTAWSPVITVNGSTYSNLTGMTLTASQTTINSGDVVHFSANATNNGSYDYSSSRIEIVDMRTNAVVRTCYYQSWCVTDISVTRLNGEASVQYYAVLRNSAGTELVRGYSPVISFNGTNNNGSISGLTLNASQTAVTTGAAVSLTANVANTSYNFSGTRIEIVDMRNGAIVTTCYNQSWCNPTITVNQLSNETSVQFYAVLRNSAGTELVRGYSPVISFNGTGTYTGTNTGMTLTTSQTQINPNDPVQFTATVTNGAYSGGVGNRIEIVDVRTGAIAVTCYNTSSCTPVVAVSWLSTYGSTAQYYAVLRNSAGTELARGYSPVITFYGVSNTNASGAAAITGVTLTTANTFIRSGDTFRLTANAINTGNWNYANNRLDILDTRTNTIVSSCWNQSWCAPDVTVYRNGSEANVQFVAIPRDSNGVERGRGYSPVITFLN